MGFLFACASPRPLSGGDKDETPPAIIEAESTPNKQVNFTAREIIITFDEWVSLKDIYNQLIVSPLMPDEPDIKQKGKSIVITLPDTLLENTTYSINFGNAITDLNEGNILENYSFVFSTGPDLDSVSLQGLVVDAVTLKPVEGVWVMMHDAGVDSAVYKIKPAYVAKTNKTGNWRINNIRNDSFEIFALKDANINFLYDQDSELFGWLDDMVVTDSSATLPDIIVFQRTPRIIVQEVKHVVPGMMSFVIPGPQPKPVLQLVPEPDTFVFAWNADTLTYWYSQDVVYSGNAILGTDTTAIRVIKEPATADKIKLTMLSGRLHPADPLQFKSNIPIAGIDTSRIMLSQDSLGETGFQLRRDSLTPIAFSIHAGWAPLLRYRIAFLPGAVTDFWGRSNDTIRHTFVIGQTDLYGQFRLTVTELDSTRQYVLQIKAGEKVEFNYVITDVTTTTITSPPMLPNKYTIELIEDANRNGKWDTGDYQARQWPERRQQFVPEALRAGWDVETEVKWIDGNKK